jgi:hypothetical protein
MTIAPQVNPGDRISAEISKFRPGSEEYLSIAYRSSAGSHSIAYRSSAGSHSIAYRSIPRGPDLGRNPEIPGNFLLERLSGAEFLSGLQIDLFGDSAGGSGYPRGILE